MPLYKYQAANSAGKLLELTMEGDSPEDSLNRLRTRGLMPVTCYGEVAAERGLFPGNKGFNIYSFTNRLAPLLQGHVPLERALGIMAESSAKEHERTMIVSLRKGLHEGRKFSELIRSHGNRFPRIYANLIEAGEETGCLEEVVDNLRRFLNESKEQKDFLITSSIYPAIILSITIMVLALVFGVFIPRFSQIFIEMGKELPLPTQILLTFSRVINILWPLWFLLVLGFAWLIIRVKQGRRERDWWDRTVIKFPILGRLLLTIEISRLIRTLAILIENHVHLLKSAQIAVRVVDNRELAFSLSGISAELRSGRKLSDALRRSSHIPAEVIQMLRVGEESGEVGEMLGNIADELEKNVKVEIKRLLALFEPAVIVLLALVILVVVISIFLAVIEMNNI